MTQTTTDGKAGTGGGGSGALEAPVDQAPAPLLRADTNGQFVLADMPPLSLGLPPDELIASDAVDEPIRAYLNWLVVHGPNSAAQAGAAAVLAAYPVNPGMGAER